MLVADMFIALVAMLPASYRAAASMIDEAVRLPYGSPQGTWLRRYLSAFTSYANTLPAMGKAHRNLGIVPNNRTQPYVVTLPGDAHIYNPPLASRLCTPYAQHQQGECGRREPPAVCLVGAGCNPGSTYNSTSTSHPQA